MCYPWTATNKIQKTFFFLMKRRFNLDQITKQFTVHLNLSFHFTTKPSNRFVLEMSDNRIRQLIDLNIRIKKEKKTVFVLQE